MASLHKDISISLLKNKEEIALCARMFSKSEPWITLKMKHDYFTHILTDPYNETHLLRVGDTIAGAAILQIKGPFSGYIKSIVIGSKWKGKGLGKRLLLHVEKRIFEDSPNVFLCVSSFNRSAQGFYEKMGYVRIGEIPDYVVAGHSEILMRKTQGPIMDFCKDNRG